MSIRGNVKEQRKRRRVRKKLLPEYREERYQLIDGNFTHYPVGWCRWYKGWLSVGLMQTHNCIGKMCKRYEAGKNKSSGSGR